MREIIHQCQDEVNVELRADDGKFLLHGYDMDCTDWVHEVTLEGLWELLISEWWYISHCGCPCLSNCRGERIEFGFW